MVQQAPREGDIGARLTRFPTIRPARRYGVCEGRLLTHLWSLAWSMPRQASSKPSQLRWVLRAKSIALCRPSSISRPLHGSK